MTHFINASGETIPPFACMQICTPPNKWEEIQKLPITDATKQLMISGGLINAFDLPRYEQDTVLYCMKPNLVTSIFQDTSTLAFNGPSFVEPNKQGVCTVGEYPAKALAMRFAYPFAALGPAPNSWRLWTTFAEYGAFRPLYPTTHEVKLGNLSPVSSENSPRFVQFVEANNYKKATLPMTHKGIVLLTKGDNVLQGFGFLGDFSDGNNFISENEPYFLIFGIPTNFGPLADSKIAWFRNGVIEFPGLYEFRIAGRLAIKDAPEEVTRVPISLKLRFDADDGNRSSFETNIEFAGIVLDVEKYVASQTPLVKKWPEIAFRMRVFVRYLGKKGKFVLENKSSPYVKVAQESQHLTFDVRRIRWDRFQWWRDYRDDLFFDGIPAEYEFDRQYYLDSMFRSEVKFFRT